jgi:hypothetical protein
VLEAWYIQKHLDGTEKKVYERAFKIIFNILPYLVFLIFYKPLKNLKERIDSKKYAQPIGRDNTLGFPEPIGDSFNGYRIIYNDKGKYKYKIFWGLTRNKITNFENDPKYLKLDQFDFEHMLDVGSNCYWNPNYNKFKKHVNEELKNKESDDLSLLSWKVDLYPEHESSLLKAGVRPWDYKESKKDKSRLEKVFEEINKKDPDVICLRGVYCKKAGKKLREELQKEYKYIYDDICETGLFVASKYPIKNPYFTNSPRSKNKGFFDFEVVNKGKTIAHIINSTDNNLPRDYDPTNDKDGCIKFLLSAQRIKVLKKHVNENLRNLEILNCVDESLEKLKVNGIRFGKDTVSEDFSICQKNYWKGEKLEVLSSNKKISSIQKNSIRGVDRGWKASCRLYSKEEEFKIPGFNLESPKDSLSPHDGLFIQFSKPEK